MKHRFSKVVATGLLAIGLLVTAGATHAANVVFGDSANPTKATGIQDLSVGRTLYDVTFNVSVTAATVYGSFPGKFTFTTSNAADAARDAINAALNAANALAVGEIGLESDIFNIGFTSLNAGSLEKVQVARGVLETGDWITLGLNIWLYNGDENTYAVFGSAGGGTPPPTNPPPDSSAPRFIHKSVTCPTNAPVTIVPSSASPIDITDITVSTNAQTNVRIRSNPPDRLLMSADIKAYDTVVSNFGGTVTTQDGQALFVTCSASATLSVIIVGSGSL
jgi:hypothetical protein